VTVHPRHVTITISVAATTTVAAGWRPPGYLVVWAVVTIVLSVVVAWLANRLT